MHAQPLILLFLASAILNFSLAVFGWKHRRLPGATAFSLAMLMFGLLPLLQTINELSIDPNIKVIALKSRVEATGIGATAWLVMIMQLTGYSYLVNRRLLVSLSIVPLGILILIWTDDPLFRSGYYLDSAAHLHWSNGPLFWFGFLYLNIVLLTPLVLLWRSYGRISPLSWKQSLALSFSVILPITLNGLIQLNITTLQGINFPFAAGPVMGLIVLWAIFQYRLFNLVPIARGLLIENMLDGVLVVDNQNRIVDVNAAMQQMIGLDSEKIIGKSMESVLAPWSDFIDRFRNVFEIQSELFINGKYLDLRISPISDRHNQQAGRLIVIRDITKRKQAENSVRLQAAALNAAANAIAITDRQGLIQWVNPAFTQLTGYTLAECLGQSMRMLRSRKHSDAFYENLWQTIKSGLIWEDEITNVRKDGYEYIEQQTITPVTDEHGEITHFVTIKQDSTGRRRMEEELRRQNRYLAALHQITLDLLNRRNLDDLLQGIVDRAVELLNVPYCEIMFLEGDELVMRAFTQNQPFLAGHRIKRGDASLSWRAFDTRRPVTMNDYAHWPHRRAIYEELHLSAVVALPILLGDTCIGVLGLSRSQPGHGFDDSEIQAATLFAQLAALALDNTELFTNVVRQSQELRLLQKVRTAISRELDFTQIVRRTVEAIAEIFGYTLVSLYLLEGETLVLQHQVGYEKVISRIPITEGVSGRAIRTGQPIFLEDVRTDSAFLGSIDGIVSEVAVPILNEEKPVGILNVESRHGVRLTKADLDLMLALSDQISIALSRAKSDFVLRQKNEKLSILHEIALALITRHTVEELPQMITDQFVQLLDADGSYIALQEGHELVDRAITPRDFPYEMTRGGAGPDLVWQVYESRQLFVTENFSALSNIRPKTAALGIQAAAFLPILYGDICLGVLGAMRFTPNVPFDDDDIQFGYLFSKLAAVALDNAQLHDTLRQETIHDSLTGLFNRRFMEEALRQELRRAERSAHPLTVVMMDLDHFKMLNDTFGHDIGDEALRKLGLLLKTYIRGSDVVCRYGGEEFTMILPNTAQTTAIERMEQLRKEIKQLTIPYKRNNRMLITGSFGIAVYPQHGATVEQLLKVADEALYRAKQAGRDCVISA